MILIFCQTGFSAVTRLKIGSNRLGTSFYVQGATVADVVTKNNDIGLEIEAMPIAGGVGNITLIEQNKTLDFALTMNNNAMWAINGICGFDEKATNIRALLGGLDRYFVGVMVRSDLGISSLDDIAKKKPKLNFYTQEKGSTAEKIASQVLEACGLTYESIEQFGGSVHFTDAEAITNAFKDGYCDVFVLNINKGHPVITEIALTGKLSFISFSEPELKFLNDKYGFIPTTLPAGTFDGQDKDIPTGGSSTMIIAPKVMSDEIAYAITKAVAENKDSLIKGHKAFSDFDPAEAADENFNGTVPLHPGAEKYFKEKNLLKQ
jgi:TRAP transporter TAXI family solute receptor